MIFFRKLKSFSNKINLLVNVDSFFLDYEITNISKIHQFFYEKSNYKVGASENNLQIDINENWEELFNNESYFPELFAK